MSNSKIKVAVVDDHVLLRNGLANLVNTFGDYEIAFQADNGKQLIEQIIMGSRPDIVLLDINMPECDGYESSAWLQQHYPEIKVLALSMYDHENAIIRMLKNGVRGYVLKDIEPVELKSALHAIWHKGYYYSEIVTSTLIHTINNLDKTSQGIMSVISLTEREIKFLKLVCTEMTYKEIADQLVLSPRTIDGYRDSLFEKLKVKTRVGLVMYAIRNKILSV